MLCCNFLKDQQVWEDPKEVTMTHLRKITRRKPRASSSQLKMMVEHVKSSSAWNGTITILEGQAMLQGQPPFTYMLSEGLDRYHYILHYVGEDYQVHLKNVRISYKNGLPIFRNGGAGDYEKIEDLVPGCLRCSPTISKPLA